MFIEARGTSATGVSIGIFIGASKRACVGAGENRGVGRGAGAAYAYSSYAVSAGSSIGSSATDTVVRAGPVETVTDEAGAMRTRRMMA